MQEVNMVQKLSEADSVNITREDILDVLIAVLPQTTAMDRFEKLSIRQLQTLLITLLSDDFADIASFQTFMMQFNALKAQVDGLSPNTGGSGMPRFEFARFFPNTYTYSATKRNNFGPLYVVYKQAAELPVITIDDEYFDTTWSTTKPTDSDTLNTYYAIAYDEGTDGTITDLLGVEPAKLLNPNESVSIYYSPTNVAAPTEGTVSPASPWVLATPTASTSASAYYTVRVATEFNVVVSETELPEHNSFRVAIGEAHTSWIQLPFSLEEVSEQVDLLLENLVGESVSQITSGLGTRYNYTVTQNDPNLATHRAFVINNSRNIFSYDLSSEETQEILGGRELTFVFNAVHDVTRIHGNTPIVYLKVTAGNKTQTYQIDNDFDTTIRFTIPNERVTGIQISASGTWNGLGTTAGYVVINSATLHERGSHEDLLEAWWNNLYDAKISEVGNRPLIPSDLAIFNEGAPSTNFRQASQDDISALNIVYTTNNDNTVTVEGNHIDVKFRGAGSAINLDPTSSINLGNGRHRYVSPVNRPVYVIADIPENWQLDPTVSALINGQSKSIAGALANLENLYQALANQDDEPIAVQNFHRHLSQRHKEGTTVTPWSANTGYILNLMAAWRDSVDVHNIIPSNLSAIEISALSDANAEFKLQNSLFIRSPETANKKHLIGMRFQFPDRVLDNAPIPVLSIGIRGSQDHIDILDLSRLGFTWNTFRSAGQPQTTEYDEVIPDADGFGGVIRFDDTAKLIRGWNLPSDETTFTLRATLKENGNPIGGEQTWVLPLVATNNFQSHTLTFSENGVSDNVVLRYQYNATTRHFQIESGGDELPHRAAGRRSIDELEVRITRHRSETTTRPASYRPVQVNATSGTKIGLGTERQFYIVMQPFELANGNLGISMATKENTSGNVVTYTRQDLGINADVYDFSRIRASHPRFQVWNLDYVNNPLMEFTDAQLAAFATAEALLFGLATEGSTRAYSYDEIEYDGNLEITGRLTVDGDEVVAPNGNGGGGSSVTTNVVAPVGTTSPQNTQYDLTGQLALVVVTLSGNEDILLFIPSNVPQTGAFTTSKRLSGPTYLAINVERVSGQENRFTIRVSGGSNPAESISIKEVRQLM